MVLKITVKTLDSQNYQFEAEQDWTITQFKEHIQDTVNVPASEQRLIFCGRVLQDDKKLTEYDCNEKVIHLVRRPPPSPGDESPTRRMATDSQDNSNFASDNMHIEGSFIITATTVETSTSSSRPHATATVFVTSDSDTPGANIPVTIPLAINTQTGFPILPASFPIPNFFAQGGNQTSQPQPNQEQQQSNESPQSQVPREQEQRSSTEGSASTNPTVTQPQYAMISGLVPVQFEYLLTYLPTSNDPTGRTNARIQFRPSRRSGSMQPRTSSRQPNTDPSQERAWNLQANREPQAQAGANASLIDPSSMEIISTILNSIFRQPNQAGQHQPPPQQQQQQQHTAREMPHVQMSGWFPTAPPNPTTAAPHQASTPTPPIGQDPFMSMIPELAMNAASQILSGIWRSGYMQQSSPSPSTANQSQAQPGSQANSASAAPTSAAPQAAVPTQAQPRRSSSGSSQYMDIEIDEGTSSQSGSRYNHDPEDEPTARRAGFPRQNLDRAAPTTSRPRLSEILRDHPTWIPIIEADIAAMERSSVNDECNYFSDAYLSSIPKKRRRMLTRTPDDVPILQPNSSQAIMNILRRAIANTWDLPTGNLHQILIPLANDKDIQEAYEEYIRSAVSSRLESDEDFSYDRHKNTRNYFK